MQNFGSSGVDGVTIEQVAQNPRKYLYPLWNRIANIFMDIVFDKWIAKESPNNEFERYADDTVIHCRNIKEALRLLEKIKQRLKKCKLELNQEKSKIVYSRNNQKRQPPCYRLADFSI